MTTRALIKILIAIAFVLLASRKGFSQFAAAQVGVDGLTCSQCTRSVEMSLLKLDFIKDVKMDLESTVGKIIFKEGAGINFHKIAKAVTDAGFSVRFLKALYTFSNLENTTSIKLVNVTEPFYILNDTGTKLSGTIQLMFLGKQFMPWQEFSKWKKAIKRNFGEISKDSYYVTTRG